MQHKPLDQQFVVVFGASSGISRATALTAVKRGASVLATGRDRAALDTLAADADTDRGGRIEITIAEATDPAQAEAAAAQAVFSFGRIDTCRRTAQPSTASTVSSRPSGSSCNTSTPESR